MSLDRRPTTLVLSTLPSDVDANDSQAVRALVTTSGGGAPSNVLLGNEASEGVAMLCYPTRREAEQALLNLTKAKVCRNCCALFEKKN